MLTVRRLDTFKSDYKRVKYKGKHLVELHEVIAMLAKEEKLSVAYSDYALHGEWAGHRECHIEADWLLVYKIDGDTLYLVRTGTYAELFRSWRGR